jgi:hypothetical protein
MALVFFICTIKPQDEKGYPIVDTIVYAHSAFNVNFKAKK